MLLMYDQNAVMSGGDRGQDGEEPAFPSGTTEGEEGEDGLRSGHQDEQAPPQRLTADRQGAVSGEEGQEDEEMIGASNELSSFVNESPESARGCPSPSTKSSELAVREKGLTHREMMSTVAEMKKRIPSDKRSHSKASTVEALNYALNCVKQVQANSEYYKLLMQNGQNQRKYDTVCTLEELERVTSEHNLKNTDSFLMVFSLSSGRVLYTSEQAPSLLCCKRKYLESAKFVELLFHQDVNVFYSHTAQPHLPPWSNSHSAGVLFDSAQVKSFFCRIRGSKDCEGEMRYNPFRITPYLLKVQGTGSGEEEPCCLALAERIISGYEAPRIPMDKRIFTTTHSPGCVFLEVDDRAVPLLGYMPQDLIGTSLLTFIHPEDRPLMLSMHRQILKYAGQAPFEHSPVRLRCQNGDYITLDTSWSSFINPWSRKVAFIIGRHKVRTSPLNEDVFAARRKDYVPVAYEEIKDLQAKIYKLFLQPVHNNGSSGYGSLGSNVSHEHYVSFASSSDSNGNLWEDSNREPMTLQQICADVNKVKCWGRHSFLVSSQRNVPPGRLNAAWRSGQISSQCDARSCLNATKIRGNEESRKQTHSPSYQQINCVDNIIRYLEGCAGQVLKRKNHSPSLDTTSSSSSTSEEEKPTGGAPNAPEVVELDSEVSVGPTAAAVVGAPLTDITMSSKAMSVVSVTSLCSYSSTIVHVPQPESEATAPEDAQMSSEPADTAATPVRPTPSPATEERRLVGLTKEVLSAHTQKEEQEYVDRFRHRILQSPYSSYLLQENSSMDYSHQPGDYLRPMSAGGWNRSRRAKARHKRPKPQGSSASYASPDGPRCPVPDSSWPSSESSQPQTAETLSLMTPISAPLFPVLENPETGLPAAAPAAFPPPEQLGYNFNVMPSAQTQPAILPLQVEPLQNVQNFYSPLPLAQAQSFNPYVAPVMAVILPSYPTLTSGFPSVPSAVPQGFNVTGYAPVSAPFPQPQFQVQAIPPTQTFQVQPAPPTQAFQVQTGPPTQTLQVQTGPPTQTFQVQTGPPTQTLQVQTGPPTQTLQVLTSPPTQTFQVQTGPPTQTLQVQTGPPTQTLQVQTSPPTQTFQVQTGPPTHASPGLLLCSQKASSSVGEEEDTAGPQALFSSSRSSSPLQLNLLQEELPKPSEGQSSTGNNHSESLHEQHPTEGDAPSESGNQDAQSTCSELLDLLLQEDARSGTGSNASGSGSGESGGSLGSGSGSNETSTSHTGSSNSSKYFASNDSSNTSRKTRKSQEAAVEHGQSFDTRVENSLWNMIQHTPERVMMTYQIRTRDQMEVLAEDREKLQVLQPLQPWFSQEQREELSKVHPWIKQHTIPQEINTHGCVSCSSGAGLARSPHPMLTESLSTVGNPQQDKVGTAADALTAHSEPQL